MKTQTPSNPGVAVVTGVGAGLGAALCQHLCAAGHSVIGLARKPDPAISKTLAAENFRLLAADVSDAATVASTFAQIRAESGPVRVLIHNASQALIKPFAEISANEFEASWRVTCLGGMTSAAAVIPGMLEAGGGSIVFTGATASIRGGARFAAFASAKFALRGLSQSLAREFGPQGIHVAHVLIDGLIWGQPARERFSAKREHCLEPDAIAASYLHLIQQQRSAWTQELDLRPDVEKF